MLDTFSKKTSYTFLVDRETFGIIAYHPSISVINALAEGIQNSSVMTVSFQKPDERFFGNSISLSMKTNYTLLKSSLAALIPSECNVAKKSQISQTFGIGDMDKKLVTDNWIKKRTLAQNRLLGLHILEQTIERYISRAKFFIGDEYLVPYLSNELKKCDPENKIYSDVIVEWSQIADVTVDEAHHLLSNKLSSVALITSRLHAIWFKYVNKINQLLDEAEILKLVRTNLESEIRAGTT